MIQNDYITKADLEAFKIDLIESLKSLLTEKDNLPKTLKTYQVERVLKVSNGTIQNYRKQGLLNPKKIGGTLYYSAEEVGSLLTINSPLAS